EAGSTPAGPLTSSPPAADEARIAGSPAHVTQTGEHFCETFCEERKRLLARAKKAETAFRRQVYDAREAAEATPDESLIEAIKDLRKRAEKAEAEVERLRGRDAEP